MQEKAMMPIARNTKRPRRAVCLALALSACSLTGCGLSGTWKTVRVDPAEYADSMYSVITFGEDGLYSGTVKYDGQVTTDVGKYDWHSGTLVFTPREGEQRVYKGSIGLDKRLRLSHTDDGRKVVSVMEQQRH
jgi:hypothetical protein